MAFKLPKPLLGGGGGGFFGGDVARGGGGGSGKVVSTPAVTKSLETQFSRFTTPSTKNNRY